MFAFGVFKYALIWSMAPLNLPNRCPDNIRCSFDLPRFNLNRMRCSVSSHNNIRKVVMPLFLPAGMMLSLGVALDSGENQPFKFPTLTAFPGK